MFHSKTWKFPFTWSAENDRASSDLQGLWIDFDQAGNVSRPVLAIQDWIRCAMVNHPAIGVLRLWKPPYQKPSWLVVGPPLWKIWKSIGMISNPIYGKIKNVPNHQPAISFPSFIGCFIFQLQGVPRSDGLFRTAPVATWAQNICHLGQAQHGARTSGEMLLQGLRKLGKSQKIQTWRRVELPQCCDLSETSSIANGENAWGTGK